MNYINAKNSGWLLGVLFLTLNLANFIAWSQNYFIHLLIYLIVLIFLIPIAIKNNDSRKLLLIIFSIFIFFILSEPVSSWDARSIWFFHAKRIFFDNNLYAQLDNYMSWSHNDYPPLIPAIAASITKSFNFWNEYLPRLAVLVGLFPVLFIFEWLLQNKLAFSLWIAGLLILCKYSLVDGYMDSMLAIYAATACLLIMKLYSESKDRFKYYIPLALTLASLPLIKNEGLLATLIFTVILIPKFKKEYMHLLPLITLILFCSFLWRYPLMLSHIHNELFPPEIPGVMERFITRLFNFQEMIIILKKIVHVLGIVFILFIVCLYKFKRNEYLTRIPILFSVSYIGGLIAVYIITPLDLIWHLDTSASRTLLPIKIIILTTCILLFFNKKNLSKN